jgi:hypothetical protein
MNKAEKTFRTWRKRADFWTDVFKIALEKQTMLNTDSAALTADQSLYAFDKRFRDNCD